MAKNPFDVAIEDLLEEKPATAREPVQPSMAMPEETVGEAPRLTEEEIQRAVGLGRELATGATLGAFPYAEAGVRAAVSGQPYEQERQRIRRERTQFQEAYPGAAMAAQMVGGLPLGGVGMMRAPVLAPMMMGGTMAGLEAEGGIPERAAAAALGGALGAAGGAAARFGPRVTAAGAEMMRRGIPLTAGQAMGVGPRVVEGLLGGLPIAPIAGISAAQRKPFYEFNKQFIEESLAPIGFKAEAGDSIKNIAMKGVETAKSKFKEAVKKANITDTSAIEDLALKRIETPPEGLTSKAQDKLLKEFERLVSRRIEDGKMSGEALQDALQDLRVTAKSLKKGLGKNAAADQRIGFELDKIRNEILDVAIEQSPENIALAKARQAYSNIDVIKDLRKSAKKSGLFTPMQAEDALEKQFGARAANLPQFRLVEAASETLGGRALPKGRSEELIQGFNFRSMPGALGSLGLAGAATAAPVATGLGTLGLTSLYRGGRPGQAAARALFGAPRTIPAAAVAAPAVPAAVPGLVGIGAEDMTVSP